MNVGFINIYPWRPHGFHAAFLEHQCKLLGYSTFFLECGGSYDACTSKLNRSGGILRCIQCNVGRVSKYVNSKVHEISSDLPKDILNHNMIVKSLTSNAVTLHREEADFDYHSNQKIFHAIDMMTKNYLKTYYSTLNFIDKENLESLIVFNGRFDMTRAAIDAAKFAKINFITHDRPIMGHGIQININENVIGLKDRISINSKFDDKPLTEYQSQLAGGEIAKRFIGNNFLEWRQYNLDSKKLSKWPTSTKDKKILILPSSISEKAGHEDHITPWKLAIDGFDLFLNSIGVKKDQVVVKFHPHWIEKRGKSTGQSSHTLYKKWCEKNSYHYIDSNEKIRTIDLIDKCDLLLLNGSTAAIEGGVLGKKIVNMGPSNYKGTSFCKFLETKESITGPKIFDNWISKEEIIQKTLRYVYTAHARYPQYVDYVRGISTTECIAFSGGNPERLEKILKKGFLKEDDGIVGSLNEEKKILSLIIDQQWTRLLELSSKTQISNKVQLNLSRCFPYNFLDATRKFIKRGDL